MSRPVYLVEPGTLGGIAVGATVRLDGPEGRHATTVRRTRVGERLTVADGRGRSVTGAATHVEPGRLDLLVEEVGDEPEQHPRLVLVQALAKGDRDEQAVEAATECGVDEVVPWQAARSIVQWRGPRGEKAWRKWEAVILAATKQSRRTRTPVLAPAVTTRELAERVRGAAAAYVLHEEATTPLAGTTLPADGDVLLVVGPEGGIGDEELAVLTAAGAMPARLGATVLRSSSAGPAALAVLSAAGRWR